MKGGAPNHQKQLLMQRRPDGRNPAQLLPPGWCRIGSARRPFPPSTIMLRGRNAQRNDVKIAVSFLS